MLLWVCCRGCCPLLKASPGLHQQQCSGGSWRCALRDAPCLTRQAAQRQRYRNTSCSPRSLWLGTFRQGGYRDPGRVGWWEGFRNVTLHPAKSVSSQTGGEARKTPFLLNREKAVASTPPSSIPCLSNLVQFKCCFFPSPLLKRSGYFFYIGTICMDTSTPLSEEKKKLLNPTR